MSTVAGKPARGARRRKYAPRLPPEERREQVLDAALALIAESGYEAASMEAVARRTGVAKPVVYDLFANRAELLRALLEREERRALRQLEGVVPANPTALDPDDLLCQSASRFFGAVAESPERWRLILMPIEGTPELVREHVARGRATLLEQATSLLEWGLAVRGGPPGLEADLAARAVLALGQHGGRLVLTAPEEYTQERLAEFVRCFVGGLERTPRA